MYAMADKYNIPSHDIMAQPKVATYVQSVVNVYCTHGSQRHPSPEIWHTIVHAVSMVFEEV